jgi:Tol biopolymer transport system component/tRNA A-37 threonylcarbamoyl transferase component Bud32
VDERDSYLNLTCRDEDDVRLEVREMLDDFEEAGDFLELPPAGSAGPAFQPRTSQHTFQPGEVLVNRFRVLAFIGSGGMGQVYRAEDMLSGGTVALKSIRPEIAADTQSSRRFRRELRLSRQVTHPNVCRVYELWSTTVEGGADAVFLTMELLEGETLASRLARQGKLAPKAALAIAKQIAAGIAEVHRIGIVHRDVKPSNVYLVPDGAGNDRAVVMDFGLARTVVLNGAPDVTVAGAMLGTPAYMAPELFNGKEATVQSDIYGFGVTLYEMLTGRDRMVVAPRKLVAGLDKGWERAIVKCLDPEPSKRPGSVMEAISLIERGPVLARLQLALIAGAAAAVLIALFVYSARHPSPVSAKAPKIARLTFDKGLVQEISYSADGNTLAYSSDQGTQAGNLSIWLDDRKTGDRRQIVKSPWNDYEPALSPDAKLLAFRSDRDGSAIYTVPVAGGTPKFLAAYGHHPRFSADGKFLAYWIGQPGDVSDSASRGYVIPVTGGTARPIGPSFADVRYPVWSPSGHQVMFWGAPTALPTVMADTDWYVENMDTGVVTRTNAFATFHRMKMEPHSAPVFWDRNSIVFSARVEYSNNLWEMGFSPDATDRVGEPHHLTTGAGFEVLPWVLPDGKITYANWTVAVRIWRVAVSAGAHEAEQVTDEDARDLHPTISQDGRYLLFGRRLSDLLTVCLHDLSDQSEKTITKADRRFPTISPDGLNAAYLEETPAGTRLFVKNIASDRETAVCERCGPIFSWLPDNTGLLYLDKAGAGGPRVRLLNLSTRADSVMLAGDAFTGAVVSPDLRRIAFTVRADSAHSAIYTAPFLPGAASTLASRIPTTGESLWEEKPQWSADGREILFSSNRDGFACLWRQSLGRDGNPVGQPRSILHMHRAGFSPLQLSHVPAYNLAFAQHYLYFNAATVTGNLWQLQP